MNNSTIVRIFDTEGNSLLNENISSPFIGLQAGETFWYGTDNNRIWAKIIKITYGLDSNSGRFIIEMIVEQTTKSETKKAIPEYNFVDHGEKTISGEHGGTWQINEGDIIVTMGTPEIDKVKGMTLQVNSPSGPIIKKEQKPTEGDFIEIASSNRKVICTLISFRWGGHGNAFSKIRVTESKLI